MKNLKILSFTAVLSASPIGVCLAASSSAELQRLEEADQSDRSPGPNKIDWNVVSKRDTERRQRTLEILKSGEVRTADDYLNAAVIFQHGDAVEDTELALALATTASRIDDTNKDAKLLTAQATDRILVKLGKPQWYGTQFSRNKANGKWEISPTDPAVVSEAEREAMGIPTLSETKAHLDAMNSK
jgi:hypothetical protein